MGNARNVAGCVGVAVASVVALASSCLTADVVVVLCSADQAGNVAAAALPLRASRVRWSSVLGAIEQRQPQRGKPHVSRRL